MDTQTATPSATLIDLQTTHAHSGPQLGHESEDLNLTLLSWNAGQGVEPHVNTEVDVIVIVVDGEGEILVGDEVFVLRVGQAVLIPKGCERAIRCVSERFSYLSVHKRRRGLMPTIGGQPLQRRPST
jgi:quercetin dioxygenase-like cupin family protein